MQVTLLSCGLSGLLILFVLLLFSKRFIEYILVRRNLSKEWEGPKSHWFWGHIIHINKGNSFMTYFKSQVANYPYGHRVDVGPFQSYLRITHPDLIKEILGGNEHTFPKDGHIYKPLIPWLGLGLLILSGEEWMRHRKLLTPSFHFGILRPYAEIMSDSSKELVKKWQKMTSNSKEISLEMMRQCSLMTLDIMLKCLMSAESDCQSQEVQGEHSTYVSSVYKLSETVIRYYNSFNPFTLSRITKPGREYNKACAVVHGFSSSIIQKRKQEIEEYMEDEHQKRKHKRKYLDFLDTLLKAKDSIGRKLTDEDIRAEVDTFMFEGHDTTASGIAWSLYLMAKNKEHQEKCVEEIREVLGDKEAIEWDDLSNLTHLTLCVKESLRMYPPVPGIMRKAEKDISVCGKTIKKGTRVLVAIASLHMNPEVWTDPEIFDPTRFTVENSKGRSPFAYIPFSAGRRNCIGQVFALNEIKISLVHILRSFEISVDESKDFVECSKLTYSTKDGLYLKLKPREHRD